MPAAATGEGESGSYTVALASQPTDAVTVTVSSDSGVRVDSDADTDGNQNTLTFTTANWNTPQTVEVSAEQDDDAVDESVTLSHTASGGDYGSVSGDLVVTVTDDETATLVLTPESLTVGEGESGSYTVALASQPTDAVTVTVSSGSGVRVDSDADTGGNQNTLTFTTANWSTPQTVEMSAEQDDDAVDESVTLSHTASGGDYGSVTGDLVVTVTDDETTALVLTPSSLTVTEGGSGSYTVALASQPTDAVTVTVSSDSGVRVDSDADTNGNQNTLTFTTANWNTPQTVEVSAEQDDDAVDESVTLSHTASGGDYGSVSGDLVVTVTDDETAALLLTPESLTVGEGESGSYTVALASQPTTEVKVTVSSGSGVRVDSDADTDGNQNTLTFTTANWNTPQTVEVSAEQDDDAVDESVTLSHTASSGDYGSVSGDLVVTVTDDETAALVLTPESLTVGEGESGSYTVALASQPTDAVIVTVSSGSSVRVDTDADTNSNQNTITFTTANWNTPQTVEVSAEQDDDAVDESVTLSHTASGGDYGSVTGDLVVTVTDDETATLVLTPESLTVGEGESGSYTVALASQPTDAVTVTVSSGSGVRVDSDADTDGNQNTLTFTTANWNTPQTVEVSAEQDDDAVDESVTLSHTASGGDYGSVTGDLVVTVTDDETTALVLTPSSLTVTEGGSGSYTVALASQPTDAVTVTVSSGSGARVDSDADTDGNQNTLTFTTANWNTPQTVEVSAEQDDDAVDESVTLSHTSSGGDYGSVSGDLVVTVTDDKTAALVLTPESLTVGEGESGSYTVALASQPTTEVKVTVSSGSGVRVDSDADTDGNQNTLTFTTANWNTPQTVEVSAEQDDDAVDESVTLSHTASSGDYGSVSGDLVVTVTDDETAALVLTPESLTVGEGESGSYTVALASQPTDAVIVTVSSGSSVRVDTDADTNSNQNTITFTTANWNTPQTVEVSAEQDDDAVDESVTLSHTASGGDYGSVTGDLVVTVTDDETATLVLTPESLTVGEGESGSYTVALASQPTDAVTVTVSSGSGVRVDSDADTDGNQNTLTFTTANWNTPQTVEVSAEQDDDAVDESVTLSHTASGGDYGSVSGDLVVTVTDDETVALLLTPESLTVGEGESGSYTVALASQPTTEVKVTVSSGSGVRVDSDADTDGNQNTLTFTTANWNTPQTVEVSAEQDDDAVDESVTLSHTASGGDYGSVSGDLVVTVTDDETVALLLTPESLTVGEGRSGSYTVALASQPTTEVKVTVSSGSGVRVDSDADTDGNQNTLIFTTANWNTPQTVEVSAEQDDDAVDESVTLSHTASGGDYSSVSGDLVVTATDDETAALVLTPESLTVGEGRSGSYTVALASQPTDAVIVTVSSGSGVRVDSDADTNSNQNTLIFTTANWNTPQTVEVSAEQDDDAVDESVTLSHTASGGDYSSVSGDLVVTVTDDETAALVLTPESLTVGEGRSGSYTVALASQPTDAVIVTVSSGSGVRVDSDADTDGNQNTLTFTTANWNTPQTVEVSAEQDDDTVDESMTLSHTASGGDYGSVTGDLVVTVTDDETAALVLTPESLTVGEGRSGSYTVALASQPTTEVKVTVSFGSSVTLDTDADTGGNQNTLTFTTANWNKPQSVEVSTEQDDDAVDESVTLSHTASGGDYGSVTSDLVVTVTDDETAALLLTPDSLTVVEGGSGSYTVALASQPTDAVTVTVSSGSGVRVDSDADTGGNQNTLTFTTANWNKPQSVEVSTEQDDDAVDESVTLSHTASGGDYGSVTSDLVVTVTDDETAALLLTPDSLTVVEGGSGSYTVALASKPTAAVTVSLTSDSGVTLDTDTDTDGNQNSLSFSTTNWSTPQTVAVSGEHDDDAIDDTVALSHTASGGDYIYVTANLSVAIIDDDKAPALVFTPENPTVAEGGSSSYTVRLAGSPTAAVTVMVSAGADSGVTLDTDAATDGNQDSLSFSTSNWSTPQTVTVSGEQDDDAVDDTVTLSHSASGGDYGSVTGDLLVTVADDDKAPALVLTPERLTLAEGGSGSYTVALAGSPSAAVTVTVTPGADAGVTLDTDAATDGNQTSLSFSAANWNTPQTVEVSAEQDDDAVDDTVTLSHSASGGDYGSVTANLSVTVSDDEETTNNTNTTAALTPLLMASGTLEPLTLYVGGEEDSRDGHDAFRMNNVNDLIWTFESSDPGVASVKPESTGSSMVMVTPVREGKATITVTATATAANGNRISDRASFMVTVVTSPAEETAIRSAFSGQGRVVLGSVTDMIGERFDSDTGTSGSVCLSSAAGPDSESGTSGDNAIAGSYGSHGGYGESNDDLIASDSWQGESWNTNLAATGLRGVPHVGQRDEDSMDKTFDDLLELFRGQPHSLHPADWGLGCGSGAVAEVSRPWTLWAGTDLQWARGGTETSDFDGAWDFLYLGADRAFAEQWLGGISLSRVWGEVDYSFADATASGDGQLSSNLTAIYPYLHGQLSSNLELWAIGGIGFGDVENEREHVDGDADQGDLHMRLLSLGLRRSLSQVGSAMDLALSGDAGFLNLSAEGDGSLDGAEASIGRFRLGLELSRPFASGVEPFAQLHGRYDSGDGPTGAAGELVLGMRYGDERFTLELRGNRLISAADFQQWGANARLDYSPATNGTGLNLALTSQWGAAENGDSFLDGHTMKLPTPALVSAQSDGDSLPVEISGEIGYSLSMGQQWGILTPNLGYDHSDNGSSRSRVGLAYAFSSALDRDIELRLDLARRERRQEGPDHSIEVSAELRF